MQWKPVIFAIATLALLIATPARASDDAPATKRQESLIKQRSDTQQELQTVERRLHQLELDRKDKLEELEQLYKAHSDLDQRHSFSKDIEDEIASQTRNLQRIEQHRSDSLEELDELYRGLSQINREIADCKN